MTVTTNHRIRFAENNLASTTYLTNTPGYLTGYSYTNIFDTNRSKKWISNHNFTIDDTNNKIYINDGSDKTITLTNANYTGTTLATHIAAKLNASSANWSCSYSLTTYRFTISNTGSVTLKLATTTSSTWNTLGYLLVADQTGTSFVGQAPRIHSEESFYFDFGVARPIDFIALISPINEPFGISSGAIITLYGSNLNFFSSPAVTINIPVYETGAFKFVDDVFSTYRYWKLKIYDPMNTTGYVSFSHLYLGDYLTITQSNVANGFVEVQNDLTSQSPMESGKIYFDQGNQYLEFNSLSIGVITLEDKDAILRMWKQLGRSTPFYLSLDPTAVVSTDVSDVTKFCYFNEQPIFTQIIRDIWSVSFSAREVI